MEIKPTRISPWKGFGVEDLPGILKLDSKTVVQIVFTASVSMGVYQMRVNADSCGKSRWTRKRKCSGCLFFVSCICMALPSKSKDFYFFDSHTRDRFGSFKSWTCFTKVLLH